jgi:hypothetical protein
MDRQTVQWQCTIQSRNDNLVGYIESNGVVVIYKNGTNVHNICDYNTLTASINRETGQSSFPNFKIIHDFRG